jgi:hypothetical protein
MNGPVGSSDAGVPAGANTDAVRVRPQSALSASPNRPSADHFANENVVRSPVQHESRSLDQNQPTQNERSSFVGRVVSSDTNNAHPNQPASASADVTSSVEQPVSPEAAVVSPNLVDTCEIDAQSWLKSMKIVRNITKSFDERSRLLREELRKLHPPESVSYRDLPKLKIFDIDRANILENSYEVIIKTKPEHLRDRLWISFKGEEAVDYGGITREWYHLLLLRITNPNYALFSFSNNDNVYVINPLSGINKNHLHYFRFTGRVIGKALFDNQQIPTYFAPVIYKQLLTLPLSLRDMEYLDIEYYKSLLELLENEHVEEWDLRFTVTQEIFGEVRDVDLIENGSNILVTDDNKEEYVGLIVNYKLSSNTMMQMSSLKRGFYDIIPERVPS